MANSIPITVTGFLPENKIDNHYFSDKLNLETSDEWIKKRTGIEKRHIVSEEKTSDMCIEVAKKALLNTNIKAEDIGCIIVATSTGDMNFPGCSQIVHKNLGCNTTTISFDIQVACSGFLYALNVADSMIKARNIDNVLVIGADSMSKILDYQDRSSCILFGDGAGAVILKRCEQNIGIIDFIMGTDSSLTNKLYTKGGIFDNNIPSTITMNGNLIYINAIERMCESISMILQKNNLSTEDIKYFIPHQANIRIIQSLAKMMSVDIKKFVTTIKEHANTSAASVPLALQSIFHDIKKGDIIILTAVGAGFNWASTIIKF